ncbi:MAG TPA: DUF1559 domain-containing protein, partial [Gemmataceae bacterium]|nr:DUF1559 domain-containing protein [Gemmataceae bacterium]
MAIQFLCSCGRKLQADEAHVGRLVRCPACGQETTVPAEGTAVQPAEAVPRKPDRIQADEPPPRPAADEDRPRRRRDDDDDERDDDRPRRRRSRDDEDDEDDRPRRRGREDDEDDEDDGPRAPKKTSGKAVAALILGLASFCVPLLGSVAAIVLGLMSLSEIKKSRGRLGGKGMAAAGVALGIGTLVVGGLIGLLVPAVQSVRGAAARIQSENNLKIMALGMMNEMDTNQGQMMPHAICDKNGKPLLSWRVALLPYIEQDALYQQFKLDEPWDGPNNSRLIARMPRTYAHPEADPGATAKGLTHYRVFTGPQTPFPDPVLPFPPGKSPLHFPAAFADGTSNTILIVEATDPVTWTKPD